MPAFCDYTVGMMRRRALPRVILLANRLKAPVVEALRKLRPWLRQRARIVAEPDLRSSPGRKTVQLPRADLAVVLGGDGTLLAQARHLLDQGVPIVGVNFGKLGFLAEFGLEDFQQNWDGIVSGRCQISHRVVIDVAVFDAGMSDPWVTPRTRAKPRFQSLALNDAVITLGPPFRMIELDLAIDPTPRHSGVTTFSGDGVIVATPSGSTAYNLAAGGPIVSPEVDGLCITPICPHSLAFRPIVVHAGRTVALRLKLANAGTTLVIDGQIPVTLSPGQQVIVRRHRRPPAAGSPSDDELLGHAGPETALGRPPAQRVTLPDAFKAARQPLRLRLSL